MPNLEINWMQGIAYSLMVLADNSTNVTRMASDIEQNMHNFDVLMTQSMPRVVMAFFLLAALVLGVGSLIIRIWIIQYNTKARKKKANPKDFKTFPHNIMLFTNALLGLVALLLLIDIFAAFFMIFGWVLIFLEKSAICC
jgi:hypothetical protein